MAGVPHFNKALRNIVAATSDQFSKALNNTGKLAFTLPKGACIDPQGWAAITTLFDGTTPLVKLGNAAGVTASADDDSLWASADIAPATAALKIQVLATVTASAVTKVPLIEDLDFTWSWATTGSDGTVGVVMIVQPFFYPYKFPALL